MNWTKHKQDLEDGKIVEFRPKGNSMKPKIHSGQLVTVEPIIDHSTIKVGDAVFCKVSGNYYVHLVGAIRTKSDSLQFQIQNNHGRINGWTSQVFGKVIRVSE